MFHFHVLLGKKVICLVYLKIFGGQYKVLRPFLGWLNEIQHHMGQSIQECIKKNLWKTAFKKFYLVHSWILCPISKAPYLGIFCLQILHNIEHIFLYQYDIYSSTKRLLSNTNDLVLTNQFPSFKDIAKPRYKKMPKMLLWESTIIKEYSVYWLQAFIRTRPHTRKNV